MAVELRRTDHGQELDLSGEWRLAQFEDLKQRLAAVDLHATRNLRLNTSGLTVLDLSCAWALRQFLQQARDAGVSVSFNGEPPDQLRLLDETLKEAEADAPPAPPDTAPPASRGFLTTLGRHAVQAWRDGSMGLAFLGRIAVTFAGSLGSLKRLRPISIARHVYDTGITAVPIVALIAFLISVIIAYMSAQQLRGLGADIYVVDLVTIGVLRELGVLLTSVIVAGRSGSAFAAELGSMKLNEEVDALIATGVDPFEALIVPRILGLTIALPLLTIVADLIGIAGGALLCRYLLDMPLTQYLNRAADAVSPSTFWVGLFKAPVFALLIAMAGCYRGMQVRSSARELGRLVTVAVVQAIFLVILADALFAVLFMKMNL
ncbi:MAG TPA: ABC transporter permease [Steroidobacteraceae bacterium]|jgi:phospholipid/cholesterol/gamma-HCH transport system permease protein|nr:ABC transporter permease [Steroidobacteraceae bacterium]